MLQAVVVAAAQQVQEVGEEQDISRESGMYLICCDWEQSRLEGLVTDG